MVYTNITLGELLSSQNETIKRNAISILKQYQKRDNRIKYLESKGLKIIKVEEDSIDYKRDDGVKIREQNNNLIFSSRADASSFAIKGAFCSFFILTTLTHYLLNT